MAENIENNGCSQRDSAEHEGYWVRIAEFKEKLKKKFGLTIDDLEWQDLIEKYKDEIKRIKLK